MYEFIINSNAQSGKGIRIWRRLKGILDERGISYREHVTEYAGHAARIAKSLSESESVKTQIIVVLGGDGTLNEVVNGLISTNRIVLGYIPAGSSNDFARSLRISVNPEAALKLVLQVGGLNGEIGRQGEIKEVNYGVIVNGEGEERRFMVSAGIGFDAAVCFEAMQSKVKRVLNKIGLGKLTYLFIAVKQLVTAKETKGRLRTDDGRKFHIHKLIFASAQNHPYEGGGFFFCPDANPMDDVIDVCMADDLPKWKMMGALPLALKGKHIGIRGITILKCKSFQVETQSRQPVHTDGEIFGRCDKVEFRLGADKIKVITG